MPPKTGQVTVKSKNEFLFNYIEKDTGGERGIRTLDTVSRIYAFQAYAFNHSATSPEGGSVSLRAGR